MLKRDLKINYSKIANISNQINSYKSALETMENSLKSIKDALETENSGDAIKSLIDNYNSLESYISSCKGELEDLYNLFGGYYYDMTAIIRPINEASIMQVDRDDIWFNMQSIKGEISEIGNINNSYSSLDYSYANPMYYPSTNEEDKKSSEENYRKIEEIKEKIKSSANKIKGYEEAMDSLFNNKIVHYENMDDEYASKAKSAYNKYASAEEVDYISAVNAGKDIKNFFTGVYNSFKGLVEGTVELFLGTCMYATGAAVLLTGKEQLSDCDKDNISAFHKGNEMLGAILEDPELILEGISQQVSDDFDQKGIAYSTGSLVGLVAQIAITKKVKVEFTKLGLSDEILSKGKILINGEEVSMAEILAKRGISAKSTSAVIEKLSTEDIEKLYKYLEKKPVGFKCDDIIDRIEKGESVDDILKGAGEVNTFEIEEYIKQIKEQLKIDDIKLQTISEDELIRGISEIKDENLKQAVLEKLRKGASETRFPKKQVNGYGKIFESEAVSLIPDKVTGFDVDFGMTGQLNLVTSDYIIDCYIGNGSGKKITTFLKYFKEFSPDEAKILNPNDKKIILFAPNFSDELKISKLQDKFGGKLIIVRNKETLINMIEGGK